MVEGGAENFKVTLAHDLIRAEALLRQRAEQGQDGEEVLLVECYVDPPAVDALLAELEARDARVDEIERDLPGAAIVRAYASNAALRGFGARLSALAGADALYTVHLSHLAPRAASPLDRRH